MIAYGPLLADDGVRWLETAVLVRAASEPERARAVVSADRYADVEVRNWALGGRPG
jgi:hypothetical protein